MSMQPLMAALPNPAPAAGRPRRRRRRGRATTSAMGAAGSGSVTIRDSEIVALDGNKVVQVGAKDEKQLPRLQKHLEMYERYRVLSLTVSYVPLSGTATAGNVAVTVLPGPKRDSIKDSASVQKCQPLILVPAWKAGTIRAGPQLDSQRFLHVGGSAEDAVAATIYAFPSAANLGSVRISYAVQLSFPMPF